MHSRPIWWNGLHILQRYLWYFVRWCCHLGNRFTMPSTNLCWLIALIDLLYFYARKQLLLSSRLSHRNSVRPSVCPSIRPSVTRMDQSKAVQARITKFSPSAAWNYRYAIQIENLVFHLAWTPQFLTNILNRNYYRLLRNSWALAQISCSTDSMVIRTCSRFLCLLFSVFFLSFSFHYYSSFLTFSVFFLF